MTRTSGFEGESDTSGSIIVIHWLEELKRLVPANDVSASFTACTERLVIAPD